MDICLPQPAPFIALHTTNFENYTILQNRKVQTHTVSKILLLSKAKIILGAESLNVMAGKLKGFAGWLITAYNKLVSFLITTETYVTSAQNYHRNCILITNMSYIIFNRITTK